MSYDLIIGIDPDIEKDGFACLYPLLQKIEVHAYPFGKTLAELQKAHIAIQSLNMRMIVVIEAGWLNKSNFHLRAADTKAIAVRKGVDQGRNHQRGIDIAEYCKYNRIPYRLQAPLRKLWQGHDRKISQPEIENIIGKPLRTTDKNGHAAMPNQEMRDALLLAWTESGLPLRFTPKTQ